AADRTALPGGRDHPPQQLAHADAPPEAPPPRPGVELHQALLERDEPAHARHRDAAPRAAGIVLAAGTARRRRRPARAVIPPLSRGVAVRGNVGDPAQHPGRARARAAALAVTGYSTASVASRPFDSPSTRPVRLPSLDSRGKAEYVLPMRSRISSK